MRQFIGFPIALLSAILGTLLRWTPSVVVTMITAVPNVCRGELMIDMGTLPGGSASHAVAIDNGLAVGWADVAGGSRHPVVWSEENGLLDLGTFGGSEGYATAVRNGVVVGYATTPNDDGEHAFVWTAAGGKVDLGTLGGSYSYAYSVDENGMVAGFSYLPGDAVLHGFAWTQGGGMVDLGTLGGSWSQTTAISNGRIVGASTPPGDAETLPFSWTIADGMVNIGSIGGPVNLATAVDGDAVVGFVSTANNEEHHCFLWTPTDGLMDLGTLGGDSCHPSAISNGQVVGESRTIDGETHAFVWTADAGMLDIFPGGTASAQGVSDELVVGSAESDDGGAAEAARGPRSAASGLRRAFKWKEDAGPTDLGTLGGSFSQALHIRHGQIAGSSTTTDGDERGVIWLPSRCPLSPPSCRTPEKSSLKLRDASDDTKDVLKWKWIKGQATGVAEFADPLSTTNYTLCVYAGPAATLLTEVQARAGVNWQANTAGFKHKSGKPSGVKKKMTLKAGAAGRSKVVVLAKGRNLADPALGPIEAPVVVRLVRDDDASLCWGSTFDTGDIVLNGSGEFSAKTQ